MLGNKAITSGFIVHSRLCDRVWAGVETAIKRCVLARGPMWEQDPAVVASSLEACTTYAIIDE